MVVIGVNNAQIINNTAGRLNVQFPNEGSKKGTVNAPNKKPVHNSNK